ncbi:hypothetical protein BT69DRAFT_1347172 [Atractiella rhizophila]|nr:hypothetical protein BT69DRAFT_1347172 [Atractiella rhizophila]
MELSIPITCEHCRSLGIKCTKTRGQIACDRCKLDDVPCAVVSGGRKRPLKKGRRGQYGTGIDLPTDKKTFTSSKDFVNALQKKGGKSKATVVETHESSEEPSGVRLGFSSLDSRLGETQLVFSLGDHLLYLGSLDAAIQISVQQDAGLGLNWTSYSQLKDNSSSLGQYAEIWLAIFLARGAFVSPHSAIVGTHALSALPLQSAHDRPLDLRKTGEARSNAKGTLTAACLRLATAHDSPLRHCTEQSLTIIVNLLYFFRNEPTDLVYNYLDELILIAFDIFQRLWDSAKDEEERGHLVGLAFIHLINMDSRLRFFGGGVPMITKHHILKYSWAPELSPKLFLDPYFLTSRTFPTNISKTMVGNFDWGNQIWSRRAICQLRVFNDEVQRRELLERLLAYSKWRTTNFQLNPASSSSSIVSSPWGDEDFQVSVTNRALEASNLFALHAISPPSEELDALRDKQIALSVEYAAIILNRNREPVITGSLGIQFSAVETLDVLRDGWRDLARWTKRFPTFEQDVLRIVEVAKHLAYMGTKWIKRVNDFEDEMRDNGHRLIIEPTMYDDIPYDTQGALRIISTVILIIDIIFFILFSTFAVVRYAMFPKLVPVLIGDERHTMFFGMIPISLTTIIIGLHQLGKSYSIPHETTAVTTLWWISATIATLTVIYVPYFMSTRQSLKPEGMTALWILPVVPPITLATAATGIVPTLHEEGRSTYALTILLTAYSLLGIGLLLAYSILTLYFQRLAYHHLPGPALLLSVCLPLGPCGHAGFSLLRLGKAAAFLFAEKEGGLQELGKAMYGAGAVLGLLFWGFGMWWTALAVATLVPRFLWGVEETGKGTAEGTEGKERISRIKFSIGWWSLTFPLGSMALLTFGLGDTFESPFFRVLGTVMTGLVALFFCLIVGPTIFGFVNGSMFQAPCLEKMEKGYGLTLLEKCKFLGMKPAPSEQTGETDIEMGSKELDETLRAD